MPRTSGFTIVELLVSIVIMGLLMALLLPAVQQVRATSSRTVCSSHLHQIGVAVESYVATHQQLPYATHRGSGLLFSILPYLEQAAEHDRLATLQAGDINAFHQALSTAARFEFYRCPVDSFSDHPGASSYDVNVGLIGTTGQQNAFLPDFTRALTWKDVTDGLSQTALCSEIRTSPHHEPTEPIDPRYGTWQVQLVPRNAPRVSVAELDQFSHRCVSDSQSIPPIFQSGSPGYLVFNNGYNHVGTPNSPACINDNLLLSPVESHPASSNHASGVNVLMADGSVHFASSNIDLHVWRAVGSLNGGETESSSF